MVIIAYGANIYGAKILPYWQNIFFALHILAYFAYIVPIWINAPVASHTAVWSTFQNEGGWSSMGLTILAGQLTGISEQVGIDTTVSALWIMNPWPELTISRPTCPKKSSTPQPRFRKR